MITCMGTTEILLQNSKSIFFLVLPAPAVLVSSVGLWQSAGHDQISCNVCSYISGYGLHYNVYGYIENGDDSFTRNKRVNERIILPNTF